MSHLKAALWREITQSCGYRVRREYQTESTGEIANELTAVLGLKPCETKPAPPQLLQEVGRFIKSSAIDTHQLNGAQRFIQKEVMNFVRKRHSSKGRQVSKQEHQVAATNVSKPRLEHPNANR